MSAAEEPKPKPAEEPKPKPAKEAKPALKKAVATELKVGEGKWAENVTASLKRNSDRLLKVMLKSAQKSKETHAEALILKEMESRGLKV